jgi:hypothetical protein
MTKLDLFQATVTVKTRTSERSFFCEQETRHFACEIGSTFGQAEEVLPQTLNAAQSIEQLHSLARLGEVFVP